MPRFFFKKPVSYDEMVDQLRLAGIPVGDALQAFLKEHADHVGLSVDNARAYCRTCDKRSDQQ